MRIRNSLVAAGVTVALVLPPAQAVAASSATAARGLDPATTQNLTHAARTEAAAALQYHAYASVLPAQRVDVANVWRTVGNVEHHDHWQQITKQLNLLDNDPADNVKVVISAYQQAIKNLQSIMAHAPQGSAITSELRTVSDRYRNNVALLQQALSALRGTGKVPAAPTPQTVTIQQTAKPRYTGAFYTADLTGGANSALSDSAWNWALDQGAAMTAVDNGQAELGRLLSGLQRQEEHQTWPALSNAAGYVNGEATNLKESVAGEHEAITMYGKFASQAKGAGNSAAASAFTDFGRDEQGHLKVFSTELQQL
jgi:rubrerythrin